MKKYRIFKNITLLQVPIRDSSLFHAHLWVFMKKYRIFKNILRYFDFQSSHFNNSDVRFKSFYYSQFRCEIQVVMPSFMGFHEKFCFFKVHIFPSSDMRFKSLSFAFKSFNEKISNY